MSYTQRNLEKVDIDLIPLQDQVGFVKAIKSNPMYLATLNAALDHVDSIKLTTEQSKGLDGVIERSNTLLQEQSILFIDDMLSRFGDEAKQQIEELNS
jgi:hypothetical protein